MQERAKEMRDRTKEMQEREKEMQEKVQELLEKLRIEGLDQLQLELPNIELHLNELEKNLEMGRSIKQKSLIENQLQERLVQVGKQMQSQRSQLGDKHPKTIATRNLLETLEKHYAKLRSAQLKQPRAAAVSFVY